MTDIDRDAIIKDINKLIKKCDDSIEKARTLDNLPLLHLAAMLGEQLEAIRDGL